MSHSLHLTTLISRSATARLRAVNLGLACALAGVGCTPDVPEAASQSSGISDAPSQVVYDDALQNGWSDASWDTKRDLASKATAAVGSTSIAADFSPWGGLLLGHAPIDLSPYKTLRFRVNGGAAGGKAIEAFVKLPGDVNGTFVDIGSHCDGGTIAANAWVSCQIPLAELGAASKTITALVFQEWAGAALSTTYFDQIELVGEGSSSTCTGTPPPAPPVPAPAPSGGTFKGDGKLMPSFGGWAWGNVPAEAVARAGFEWFETGYPGDTASNQILTAANVRPFAYINLGEVTPDLQGPSGYDGPILRTNGDWGTLLVDVTNASWQSWLVRRANDAYAGGSRGIKWDVATPDIPPGKTRDDVNAAIASVMQRILDQHPDFKFIYNGGTEFALAYPKYAHGMETEGLFSASSYPPAHLKPWLDPWYWGPQYDQLKKLHDMGIPVFCAEYVDPNSQEARDLYEAITGQGFVPYITSSSWNIRGWGYDVPPGW